MARSAKAAMLSAVEVYNKTAFEYREEAFCVLAVNAWEVLLKARIVSINDNHIQSIYRPKEGRTYPKSKRTGSILTIGLKDVISRLSLPANVSENVLTLQDIRNEITHLGTLHSKIRHQIAQFGTASVQNFFRLFSEWFGEPIENIYPVPVGFVGEAATVTAMPNMKQRELLKHLRTISATNPTDDDGYHVTLRLSVDLVPTSRGGGSVGPTNDPNAPVVQLSDSDYLKIYPLRYSDLMNCCKKRYENFKRDICFWAIYNQIKDDPNCAHERKLDPNNPKSQKHVRFNAQATFSRLDRIYKRRTL